MRSAKPRFSVDKPATGTSAAAMIAITTVTSIKARPTRRVLIDLTPRESLRVPARHEQTYTYTALQVSLH
jgi:hypothetical protein